MRKKIAQRAGKALLKSGVYGLLVGALSIPSAGWADEWTQVLGTHSHSGGFLVWLDPLGTTNANNCSNYINGGLSVWFGQQAAGFQITYPASGAPTEAQKAMISQLLLASATGKPIRLLSSSCSYNGFNSIDQLWLKAN